MNKKITIAIDAMGGENSPKKTVEGVYLFKSVTDAEDALMNWLGDRFGEEEKLKINYMLIKNNNKWLIFDVLLNGSISEIATKKSEFSETLNNGGIISLISLITKKLEF